MNYQNTNPLNLLEAQFHKGFRWAVSGSMLYEACKTLHNILLTYYLTPKEYGLIASTLSFVYLVTKIADFGASTSILPFFHVFIKSKQNFKQLLFRFYLFPHIPLLLITSITATTFLVFYKSASIDLPMLLIIAATIILESVRSFLRLFLYTSLECKRTVFTDVASFLFYLFLVWIPYILFNYPITFKNILIFHIIDSLIVTILFSSLFYKIYKNLPNTGLNLPLKFKSRIINAKVFNYFLRLSREVFTSNFLTPFFALKFGFEYAGLFYLAAVIAHFIQSIFKISVGYLGNAILANLKNSTPYEKQRAFELLTRKLSTLISPLIIILFINHSKILRYANCSDLSMATIGLALLFLTIQIIDFITSLYEQFYVMEEQSFKFFCYKALEFTIFYIFISYSKHSQALSTILLGIISIKMFSFSIIALNAYSNWRIKPKFHTNPRYLVLSVAIALLAFFIL